MNKFGKYAELLNELAERVDEEAGGWNSLQGHGLLNLMFSALVDLLKHHAQDAVLELSLIHI